MYCMAKKKNLHDAESDYNSENMALCPLAFVLCHDGSCIFSIITI